MSTDLDTLTTEPAPRVFVVATDGTTRVVTWAALAELWRKAVEFVTDAFRQLGEAVRRAAEAIRRAFRGVTPWYLSGRGPTPRRVKLERRARRRELRAYVRNRRTTRRTTETKEG